MDIFIWTSLIYIVYFYTEMLTSIENRWNNVINDFSTLKRFLTHLPLSWRLVLHTKLKISMFLNILAPFNIKSIILIRFQVTYYDILKILFLLIWYEFILLHKNYVVSEFLMHRFLHCRFIFAYFFLKITTNQNSSKQNPVFPANQMSVVSNNSFCSVFKLVRTVEKSRYLTDENKVIHSVTEKSISRGMKLNSVL